MQERNEYSILRLKVCFNLHRFAYQHTPSRLSTLYIISKFCKAYFEMSTVVSQAEASKPQDQKKMQECFKCKAAGFPNQPIGFEKIGENPSTGKSIWKLIDENGSEHKHRYLQDVSPQQQQLNQNDNNNNVNTNTTNRPIFRRRRVVDVATLTDVEEARKLLAQGWDYQTSYPATISNIPHYVLVRKE
jgi:hypothetical protein